MQVQDPAATDVLAAVSDQMARAVVRAAAAVVRVDGRPRQAASGVVWEAGGLILTASHVVERDGGVKVQMADGASVAATVVGRDAGTDVALLRASGAPSPAIDRGPAARPGQMALIVARPGGDVAVSGGVVSAVQGPARTSNGGLLQGFIRTDAGFYPGFSGAPLVDVEGRMLGMATSQFGAGLVIPVAALDRVAQALVRHGRVERGFLGMHTQQVALPAAMTARHGLAQQSGLLVVGLEAGGPAERAGLLIGDVVVSLGGQPIRTADDLLAQLGPERAGQATIVRVLRGGDIRDVTVTIGRRG